MGYLSNAGNTMELKILDLFCGTKSWSKPFENAKDVEIISVDNNYKFSPTFTRDILTWDYKRDVEKADVIFASPPCDLYFSPLKLPKGILQFTEQDVITSKACVEKTLEILDYYNPKYFCMENPKGKMRYCYPFIRHKLFRTIDYCMYGFDYKKPTDIWTNVEIEFKQCVHKKHKVNIKTHNSTEVDARGTNHNDKVITGRIAPEFAQEIAEKVLLAFLPNLKVGVSSEVL